MKQATILLLILVLSTVLSAIPLSILHTNDTHGAYLPRSQRTDQGSRMIGGYAALEHHLNLERAKSQRSIYLDAGDQQTGSIFASLVYRDAVGGAVIEAFNHLDLDASTFGNHEFDFSMPNTQKLVQLAKYPFVSSNLQTLDAKPFGGNPFKIIKLDSLKIGVLGLTLVELPEKVKRENISTLNILPYKQAVDKYIDQVDKESDLIILLTHLGFEADSLLATVLDNRVDIIIGGHSHISVEEPWLVNGIYIASAGSHLNLLGKMDIEVENDRIAAFKSKLIPLWTPEKPAKTPLHKFVSSIADDLETEMNQVIGKITVDWVPDKFKETIVSRWMAEALKAEYDQIYQPDLALINCGGIRKTIPAGDVTMRDMHEMLPFSNYVVLFSCYGRDLLAMDELNKQIAIDKPYDIVQSSAQGWVSEACPGGHGHNKRVYKIHGKTIDPDKVYRVVSHDYMAGQWDKYLGFKPFDVMETGDLILDAMIRQVKKLQ
ncbi:MAG: bifunctional UDP-sugar hydrolase/5'-nucleotidase [Candidatus Cloacimonetes bacterium]|nr:bifunctional UDP-sugar hydrolase/5'-nucleotidase [Candidatus Cloacimonadota bacterium]